MIPRTVWLSLGMLIVILVPHPGGAQELDPAAAARDFFEGRDMYLAANVSSTCPGDEWSDAVFEELARPRPKEETRSLVIGWAHVAECRIPAYEAWYRTAAYILTGASLGQAFAEAAFKIGYDPALVLLEELALDPEVAPRIRDAIQMTLSLKLSPEERLELFIKTFSAGTQGLSYFQTAFGGGAIPVSVPNVRRLLRAVVDHPRNPHAMTLVRWVVVFARPFSSRERAEFAATMERRIDVFAPTDREALLIWIDELRRPNS